MSQMTLNPSITAIATPQPQIVAIIGYSRSGKDTMARTLMRQNKRAVNIKFSAPMKIAVAQYLNVSPLMLEEHTYRETIIPELGVTPLQLMFNAFDAIPQIHPRLGLYRTGQDVREHLSQGHDIIFTDTRNLSEGQFLVDLVRQHELKLILVTLRRPGTEVLQSDRFIPRILADLKGVAHRQFAMVNAGSLAEYCYKCYTLGNNITDWVTI